MEQTHDQQIADILRQNNISETYKKYIVGVCVFFNVSEEDIEQIITSGNIKEAKIKLTEILAAEEETKDATEKISNGFKETENINKLVEEIETVKKKTPFFLKILLKQ